MKNKLLFFAISLYSLITTAQVCKEDAIFKLAAQEGQAALHKINRLASAATETYNIIYHRCEWEVNPGVSYIKGAVTSYFKPLVANFTSVGFDFIDTLIVDSVKYHGLKVTVTRGNDLLKINLPNTLPVGLLDSVTVYYQGNPGSSGFGSFITDKHGPNNDPVLWTLSEPFGAKEWWPCKQDLVDKIDSIDIIVTTPKAYRVGSNGLLLNEFETATGDKKVYHWKTKYPIAAYLVAIAVTNYAVYYDFVPMGNKQLDVLNYVYPETLDAAKAGTKDIVNIITLYNQLVGDYPFAKEKYGHAQFGWGGGMEHQTMTFIVNFSQSLMAHECAHQWFGDNVTCGSWQDIWLNEGFATYFEGLTQEKYFPPVWKAWKSDKVTNITSLPGGSVLCTDTTDVNRIFSGRLSYNKGSYLLHMLRWQLGDAVFFKALKNYQNDPKLRYGYAKTPDLIKHLESESGKSLTTFFNQWYYKEGYPTYKAEITGPCCNYSLKLNQEQSHASVSFFEMPVPVKFYSKGKDTTLVFNHAFSGQIFPVTLNYIVDSLKIDPEQWLISGKNTVSYINMVGISELDNLSSAISLYPNPLTGNTAVTIQNSSTANQIDKITLTDVLGKIIKMNAFLPANGAANTTIETSGLKPGIYFVLITSGKYTITKKLVKL